MVARESNTEKVLEYVKNKIKDGEWKSGQKIPTEPELCQFLQVSRSAVREAVKILESCNILEIRHGDGTYLCDASKISYSTPFLFKILLGNENLQSLMDFRRAIEMSVIQMVISNHSEEDLKALDSINDKMESLMNAESSDANDYFQLDVKFHQVLAKATHNNMMEDVYNLIFNAFGHFIRLNFAHGQNPGSALRTHRDIVAAIRNKDYVYAGFAVQKSVTLWGDWIMKEDMSSISARDYIL